MQPFNFPRAFEALTGSAPFPWQSALYAEFTDGRIPASANIPTGLGKTAVVAVWLCALAASPQTTPRRLVYVVNRRTVVDQTTSEVEKWRQNLEVAGIRSALASLGAIPLASADEQPLAISTLRGQFADNREWSADPARPAVIVGTVDMIGSGLLFNRYTVGFRLRPHHAALLAQDTLIVHDEAHLAPAFQKLLESIVTAQNTSADPRKLRVLALTATTRATDINNASPFTLNDADHENETVQKRINAVKRLRLVALNDGEKLDAKLVAAARAGSGERAVLVFARSVETALKIAAELDKGASKGKVATLTGTMRGQERDELAASNSVFQRFLSPKDRARDVEPATGTVFLVATSAGEVGVNLSADDLVCDLSTYESMAQRFGRVNRFGDRDDSTITVVHETEFDAAKPLEASRAHTLALLQRLDRSASPAALDELSKKLSAAERAAAFSPLPEMRTATGIQFDAWALTTIREPIAARPPVAPYLHGEAGWQPPETHVAWRSDLDFRHITDPEAFLDAFPLHPRELLRDTSKRIAATLEKLLKSDSTLPDAWLVSDSGAVSRFSLTNFDKEIAETSLADAILILPTSVGGLENGLFTGTAGSSADDVSGIVRQKTDSRDAIPENCKFVHSVEISEEDADEPRFLLWCETKTATTSLAGARRTATHETPETLATHTRAVEGHARALAEKLLPVPVAGEPDLRRCLILAATLHDLGKNRAQWQRNLGHRGHLSIPDYDAAKPETILAKSAPRMRPRNIAEHYRHEFGSLSDATSVPEFSALKSDLERDIVLHLVAAHHGRARPHFPREEILDHHSAASPETSAALATEVPRRFARLQRRFGRWGLAWLESLLRAADHAASAGFAPQNGSASEALPASQSDETKSPAEIRPVLVPSPTITLRLNPANPGHYFACCGLFELAAALVPYAQAWFADDSSAFHIAADARSLKELLNRLVSSEISALDSEDRALTPLEISFAGNDAKQCTLRLDWWRHEGGPIGKLKPWAGQMSVRDIADDMRETVNRELEQSAPDSLEEILFHSSTANAGEPFYFDANRAINAKAQDVGFSVDKLKKGSVKITSTAAPAVELLCLIGLQRARPLLAVNERGKEREYEYHLWHRPLPLPPLAAAVAGLLPDSIQRFRFSNPSRAKDYRAFAPANLLS